MWLLVVSLVVVIGVLWAVLKLRHRFVEPPGAPPLALFNNSRWDTVNFFRNDTERFLTEATKKVSLWRGGGGCQGVSL